MQLCCISVCRVYIIHLHATTPHHHLSAASVSFISDLGVQGSLNSVDKLVIRRAGVGYRSCHILLVLGCCPEISLMLAQDSAKHRLNFVDFSGLDDGRTDV
jgi:hypothetical protein